MAKMIPLFLTSGIAATAAAGINHLLAQEPWARDKLTAHAGKIACLDAELISLNLQVEADGMLKAVAAGALDQEPNVTIRVKSADLLLIAQNRERAFSYVKIEGDADFANTISQLSQSLRWEVEADLAKLVGDIAAARMLSTAHKVAGGIKATGAKLSENLAEFFLEEQPMLIRPAVADEFSDAVAKMRDDVERLEKRIARLDAS